MPPIFVPFDQPVPVRRMPGTSVEIVNDSAQDVFLCSNDEILRSSPPGFVNDQATRIAAGDSFSYPKFPTSGIVWLRSLSGVTIKVEP